AGETAKFRFDFGSDSSVQYPGWYIDDVLITNINWIEEVTESIDLDIDVGQTTNIVFSDWTPSDITLPLEIFYRAKAIATIAG
ncbi:hypothetical protein, partial [Klebsiella pneumoniae]|uniref:hypothetical protein n=1 Tax=Klebsiella pneumoniae TaxID=573 RepID=UPI0025A0DC6F